MPIEVARFGVGHRRPDGPPGTVGVKSQLLHSDGRGTISEVAFARDARVEPHSSPNTTWMVVIEGGGWVAVAEERTRVAAGEAVLWPADVLHAAWTEHSEMRAIVVEFAGPDDAAMRGLLDGLVRDPGAGPRLLEPPVEGVAVPIHPDAPRDEPRDGEPT
jgi:quercetin dioxygenase-like cupin family protein